MKIRTRLTGFFLLTLTLWSLFLVWMNLKFYRVERERFLTESFTQRFNLLTELIRAESYRIPDRSETAQDAAKQRALELVREATYPNFSDGYPVIFDESGQLLFKPVGVEATGLPPKDMELSQLLNYGFGDFNITLPDGQARHIIGTSIPGWHWTIFYSFPTAESGWRQVVHGAQTRLGLTAIACVLLSAVVLFFIIRRSLRPIDLLIHKASKIASGDFPNRSRRYGKDELGTLNHAFDEMSLKLQTSLEHLQEAIQRSRKTEEFLNAIFNSVDLPVIAITEEQTITYWNNSIALYTHIPNAVGQNLWSAADFLLPERPWLSRQLNAATPQERRAVRLVIQEREYWFDFLTTPLQQPEAGGAVLIMKNVTELVQQQSQLLQAQKMETIGTLTGGLAHDFNNVLAGIRGALVMTRLGHDQPGQVLEFTALAESAVSRAAGMVSQLLALARKTPFAIQRLNWSESIEAVVKLARNTFDKRIQIITELPEEAAWIDGDATQMEQVILNLLVNSEQALQELNGAEGKITLKLFRNKALWELHITDTGPGIPREIQSKIFDPFFSTRAKGKGTGLGLSMAYNIISRHGGQIRIVDTHRQGAVFLIQLPAASAPAPCVAEASASPAGDAVAKAARTILLIDDEPMIRQTVKAMLQLMGHRVYTASGGIEGLTSHQEHPEIEVVILDMAMPDLSGEETFARLHESAPQLPVILISGYPDDPRIASTLNAGAKLLLVKPFDEHALAHALGRIWTG